MAGSGPLLLSAPDKFKGSLTGAEFCTASERACAAVGWEQRCAPLADGGEGFGELVGLGGERRTVAVSGPLGEAVEASFWLTEHGGTRRAVIESQLACGLALAGGPENNRPLEASTRGVGELILTAIGAGASEVVVGCGGSASTDGGRGALEALGAFPPDRTFGAARLLVAYDVTTTFEGAAPQFGPQKGASEEEVGILTRRLEELSSLYAEAGRPVASLPGSGAAGGLAGGLAAAGGELVSGFDLAAESTGFLDSLASARAVVTGEGSFDRASFAGKVVGGVVKASAARKLPLLCVVGRADDETIGRAVSLGATVVSLESRYGAKESRRRPGELVTAAVAEWLEGLDAEAEPS